MAENSNKANLVAKTLFIIGGVILFILLAIFILRIVPVAVSNIANVGSSIKTSITKAFNGGEEISVSLNPESTVSGEPVIVSFEYEPEEVGQYFVSYNCVDGLFYDIQSSNGPKRIVCNTPFKLGQDLNAISLVPLVTKENIFIDSTITIEYKDTESNPIAKGTKLLTIKNETEGSSATSTDSNPFGVDNSLSGSTVTSSTAPSRSTEDTSVDAGNGIRYTSGGSSWTPTTYSTTRDLAVTEIYKLNNSTFVFHVYNLGNTSVGPWEFSYTDAENPSKTLISPLQAGLAPGQGLAITVRFDEQRNSNQLISIFIDPYNKVSETSESNNTASVTITGSTGGYYGGSGSYDEDDDADLIITRMDVGKISGSRFIEDDEIDDNDTAAVRFVVKNQGGESTGSWRFEIDNLPYDNDDTYRSKRYSSLRPGESIEIIADFDGIDDGNYNIRIEVDSDDDVDEERENNNTESERLEVDN